MTLIHDDDVVDQLPGRPPAREQHPEAPICVRQPGPLDRAFQDAELMAQCEDLDGQLAARFQEGEAGQEQGAEEVEHGR